MSPEPRQREDYGDRQVTAARRVLVDLGQVLAAFVEARNTGTAPRRQATREVKLPLPHWQREPPSCLEAVTVAGLGILNNRGG